MSNLSRRSSRSIRPSASDPFAGLLAVAGVAPSTALAIPCDTVVLADISASMDAPGSAGMSRIGTLREALSNVIGGKIIPFSETTHPVCTAANIPDTESSTDVAGALRAARRHNPGSVLLVTDGDPDSREDAIAEGIALGKPVHCLYVGPKGDWRAIGFLRELAEATGGTFQAHACGEPLALAQAVHNAFLLAENAGPGICL